MKDQKKCLVCNKGPEEIPVTQFYFKETSFFICCQHIPVLIHEPQNLVGLLPDADKLQGA